MKRLDDITRTLSGKKKAPSRPVKDKNGETTTDEAKQRVRWAEHFQEILNRPPPQVPADIPPAANQLAVSINPPTKAEQLPFCQVIQEGKLTDIFQVLSSVCQGCLISLTMFFLVVDWIMKQTTSDKKSSIQWTFTKELEDLDFTDDISLLSHRHQDAQEKLSCLAEEAEKTGLNINIKKAEVMRINNKKQDPITLHNKDLNEVEKFVYLGSVVNKDGRNRQDIKNRINKARHEFNTLCPIWNSSALSLHNKIRTFHTNIKSVLLYGSETWRTTKSNTHKLQTFMNRCLRNIVNIRWPDILFNADL
ncbi:putative uncharacterized transposon-derived protein F52C9.6 [Stylophora pistillata]|uniref:Uncharacterized transposon-derived protein F52C9.6 n=1 Tax=Stylophora pistillata TaxID=50429 RepID=A0A2B4S0R8_STYPI|nr:putative uncharacterized transposon-derived protein F52C9.6 [Stylophora pistillata]